MKKIILTIVLSSLLPAIAAAEDAEHKMRNDNPNPKASVLARHYSLFGFRDVRVPECKK